LVPPPWRTWSISALFGLSSKHSGMGIGQSSEVPEATPITPDSKPRAKSHLGVKRSAQRVKSLFLAELHGPSVIRVFAPSDFTNRTVYPEDFFLAAGELLGMMIVLSWIISLTLKPASPLDPTMNIFERNALKDRIGYNNLCVAFDAGPARYISAFLYMFIAYCGIRYSYLDLQRTLMTNQKGRFAYGFSIVTDVLYVIAWALFTLTYVIPPEQDVWGHSIGFMTLGTTTWLVLLANTMEGKNFPPVVWLFVLTYGVFTIVDFGLAGINFVYYEQTGGKGPWNPWWVGFVADYGWFASLAFTSVIMPRGEQLKMTAEVVEPLLCC